MKHRSLGAGLIAALLLSAQAQATEETRPAPAKPTQVLPSQLEQSAAAHARADAAIARVGAEDLFDNVTENQVAAVRHRASGMVCKAGDDGALSLEIYPGSPRGDDVSCGANLLGAVMTTYATRYGEGYTAQNALDDSIAAIHQRFDDVKPYQHDAVRMSKDGIPSPLTARFEATFEGKKVFTRTSTVEVGEWIIAQRVTAPYDKATIADVIAEVGMATTLISVLPEIPPSN